jgi:hypothetical protein
MDMRFVAPKKAPRDWRNSLPNNELGDFQTPAPLARLIVDRLAGEESERVFEPTCGSGSFLAAAATLKPREMLGLEMQPNYAREARRYCPVIEADIFDVDLAEDLRWANPSGSLLVLGNPPWVTNSQLGSLGSLNLPGKRNVRGLRGIEAMTGASNFDIAEYMWIKLISELANDEPTIALLCKTSVARNVLTFSAQHHLPVAHSNLYVIDAKEWFNASVDACLFVVSVQSGAENYQCAWHPSLSSSSPSRTIGVVNGRLVADTTAHAEASAIDGISPIEWRQGIKHDAVEVMELLTDGEGLTTKAGEPLDLEPEHIFPLLKGTDVYRGRTTAVRRWMVVPQRSLKDDPGELADTAPRVWHYLNRNGSALDGRKSSIYRKRPRFSIFGVGDYSFSPFKVAVSGLHKQARFRAVGPIEESPVVFDDTCYFVPVSSARQAAALTALLNSSVCQKAIEALAFWDAKRPITKKLLQRLDLGAVAHGTSATELASLSAEAYATDLCKPLTEDPLAGLAELLATWETAGTERVQESSPQQASLFGEEVGTQRPRRTPSLPRR